MYCLGNIFFLVILLATPPYGSLLLIKRDHENGSNANTTEGNKSKTTDDFSLLPNLMDIDLTINDAQESANFFTSDLGAPFDSAADYGAHFENFPSLPYFPEFGEVFRISRTTTPEPPFHFPDYVRDAFPDRSLKENLPSSVGDTASSSFSDSVSGGRRPSRRPPRPASSGTRTKVSKHGQNDPRDKPKSSKSKSLSKSTDYPKIFKFTSDRVNLAEFDMKKKMNENYLTLAKGDELDSDKVKRNKFLILHGGVFEIEKSSRSGLYHASTENNPQVTSTDNALSYSLKAESEKRELQRPYFYKL